MVGCVRSGGRRETYYKVLRDVRDDPPILHDLDLPSYGQWGEPAASLRLVARGADCGHVCTARLVPHKSLLPYRADTPLTHPQLEQLFVHTPGAGYRPTERAHFAFAAERRLLEATHIFRLSLHGVTVRTSSLAQRERERETGVTPGVAISAVSHLEFIAIVA
jgi:hypothetical protein